MVEIEVTNLTSGVQQGIGGRLLQRQNNPKQLHKKTPKRLSRHVIRLGALDNLAPESNLPCRGPWLEGDGDSQMPSRQTSSGALCLVPVVYCRTKHSPMRWNAFRPGVSRHACFPVYGVARQLTHQIARPEAGPTGTEPSPTKPNENATTDPST